MRFNRESIKTFAPEDVAHLCAAFESSWNALSFAFSDRNSREANEMREALALSIIELAKKGETDPVALSSRALSNLTPLPSRRRS